MSLPTAAPPIPAIAGYRLIGQIGEGGMGVVFLAEDSGHRRVALKVLRPAVVGDQNGRLRLAREVTSLRRVRSPLIAEVYDADPWGETPYLVMRYVPGPSLRDLVRQRGPLDGPEVLRLAHGLAKALAVVHRADVLHRDVKPSNVLLEHGLPVLIDFGLAQLADDVTLTQSGWLLGTPGYLAPEILYGDGPTQAADVHAWAATVAFAATGHGPYGAGPPMAVLDRARRGEWDIADVPAEVADVVSAGLRSDPANRPAAAQIVDWLDGRMAGAPERIAELPAPEQASTTVVPVRPPESAVKDPEVEAHDGATRAAPRAAAAPEPVSPDRIRAGGYAAAIALLVVAATIALPVATLLGVIALGWGLRIVGELATTRDGWRRTRGPRRGDAALSVVMTPWLALRTLGEVVGNGCCLLAGAGAFVALARYGPAALELSALVAAGVTICVLGWRGPFSDQARVGGRLALDSLPRSPLAAVVVIMLILAVSCGLVAAQQIAGTSYLVVPSR